MGSVGNKEALESKCYISSKMNKFVGLILPAAFILILLGFTNANEEIDNILEEELEVLKLVKQKLAGKSDAELAAMMDQNGDGKLTKNELKEGLVDLTGNAELDDIANDELDLLWSHLADSNGVIDLSGGGVTDRLFGAALGLALKYGVPMAIAWGRGRRG